MTAIEIAQLALFSVTVLSAALLGLTASGHFPAEHRLPALQTTIARAVLWSSILVTGLATALAAKVAVQYLHWPYAIISAGGATLLAPLVLQWFSDEFVDGVSGLVTFAATTMALAGATHALAG